MKFFSNLPLRITCVLLAFPLCAAADNSEQETSIETMLVEGRQFKRDLKQEQAQTPGAVTLIDNAELYERNVTNLADMLRFVPGVWAASGSTGDSAFLSSRGSNLDATSYDGNGIKLLQDGLPVTAADGNNHNRSVDPLSARYAVIARGANAVAYGASTLGGAIDFVTPTARDTASQIFLNGGSHGQLQGQVTAGTIAGDVDGLITLEAKKYDGFRDNQQEQRRAGVYANAGWQINRDAQTRFYLTWIDNEQQLAGALNAEQFSDNPYQANPSNVAGNFQYNVKTWRIANKTTVALDDDGSVSVGVSLEEQALYHPIVYNPYFSLLIDTDQKNVGTSLRYRRQLGDHDLLLGVNYGQSFVEGGNYSHTEGRREIIMTVVDNEADSLELFLADRWQMASQWKLIYGAQFVSANREVRNTSSASGDLYNPKGEFESINPRIGLIYQWTPESEWFANVSRLYEPPTNFELEDDASPDGVALRAMHGQVAEFGTRGSKPLGDIGQWHWELALYYAQLQDEILSVQDPNAPGTSLSTNVDDTVHAGIEALAAASFNLDQRGVHRIEPMLSVTLNEFSFDGDSTYGNNQLPAAPGYVVKGEVLYRMTDGFFIGPTFDVVDERCADFSNSYTVDSYALLGLRAGFSGASWEVFGEARNLTNKRYVSVFGVKDMASPDAAILQAGEPRSVYVGVKLQF